MKEKDLKTKWWYRLLKVVFAIVILFGIFISIFLAIEENGYYTNIEYSYEREKLYEEHMALTGRETSLSVHDLSDEALLLYFSAPFSDAEEIEDYFNKEYAKINKKVKKDRIKSRINIVLYTLLYILITLIIASIIRFVFFYIVTGENKVILNE